MLRDHFHPPFSDQYGWKSFHTQWAAVLTADLNTRLPEGWRAAGEAEFGIEVDVGVLDDNGDTTTPDADSWQPDPPTKTIPFTMTTDVVEVRVKNPSYGPELVGAIELVSPANKDRPGTRDAFASKCASLLHEGAGLVIVDIVTSRRANLHEQIVRKWEADDLEFQSGIYATAYRPANADSNGQSSLDIWAEELQLGSPLPILPLCLRVGPTMPIDLNASYLQTLEQLRIPLERD